MLSRSLAILLTAQIVACPCFCKAGDSSRRSEHAVASFHCDCCHVRFPSQTHHEESTPPNDDSRPAPHHCGSQCICNGAVVEDAAQFDMGLDLSWWIAAEVSRPSLVAASASPGDALWVTPPPDDGANPGRTLCCRYELYLC